MKNVWKNCVSLCFRWNYLGLHTHTYTYTHTYMCSYVTNINVLFSSYEAV